MPLSLVRSSGLIRDLWPDDVVDVGMLFTLQGSKTEY